MDDNSKNRVARWTQKLLDLSLRNRLLNARDSKQILPLAVDDVASLEDTLARSEENYRLAAERRFSLLKLGATLGV